jgi:microcystin-dependent protein
LTRYQRANILRNIEISSICIGTCRTGVDRNLKENAMTVPYIGQIIMTGLDFVPRDFAACNGQLLSIHQYRDLYAVIGTRYGGDGVQNFAVPNLQGATPVGAGASADPAWAPAAYALNQGGGAETVLLQAEQVAGHGHARQAAAANLANARGASGGLLAASNMDTGPVTFMYAAANSADTVELASNTVATAGAGAGHPNMQPFRVLNFCIALHGIKPARA